MAAAGPAEVSPFELSLFKNRDFVHFWFGQAVSEFGTAVSTFALPLIVLDLTRSPTQAGLFTAVQKAPFALMGLYAGAVADRLDRKRIMIAANAVQAAALAYLSIAAATWGLSFTQLLLGGLIAGSGYVFFDVADNASFSRIAGRAQLLKASSLLEGTVQAAELCGPAVGGLVLGLGALAAGGAAITCGLDSATFLFSALMIVRIRKSLQERAETASTAPARQMSAGLRFLVGHPELRRLAASNFTNLLLLSPIGLALIVSARSRLHSDALQTGLIFTLGGLAGIAGAAATPLLRRYLGPYAIIALACLVWAVGCAVIVVADSVVVLAVAWGIIASVMPMYFSTLYSYRVTLIPDALQGRVNAAYRLISHAAAPIGAAAGGLLIGALGVRAATACLTVGFAAGCLWIASGLVKLRRP